MFVTSVPIYHIPGIEQKETFPFDYNIAIYIACWVCCVRITVPIQINVFK
jgi:hypothetical protein